GPLRGDEREGLGGGVPDGPDLGHQDQRGVVGGEGRANEFVAGAVEPRRVEVVDTRAGRLPQDRQRRVFADGGALQLRDAETDAGDRPPSQFRGASRSFGVGWIRTPGRFSHRVILPLSRRSMGKQNRRFLRFLYQRIKENGGTSALCQTRSSSITRLRAGGRGPTPSATGPGCSTPRGPRSRPGRLRWRSSRSPGTPGSGSARSTGT